VRKLKGLWLIVLGLVLLVIWIWPFVYIQYGLAPHQNYPVPFIRFIISGTLTAFAVLLNPFVWNLVFVAINLVAITGFALLFSGLYRLVRSLRESRS